MQVTQPSAWPGKQSHTLKSEVIVMFLHLAIHVHTARVLLFTVKLGAIGGTSILTGAMVAFLTSLVSRKPSNVTKVICLAFLHISEFTVGTGLFTIFQLVVFALADVAIVNYNFAPRTVDTSPHPEPCSPSVESNLLCSVISHVCQHCFWFYRGKSLELH